MTKILSVHLFNKHSKMGLILRMKKSLGAIAVVTLILGGYHANADTFTSKGTGNWSGGTGTWTISGSGGRTIPNNTDDVIILDNHQITVDVIAECNSLKFSGTALNSDVSSYLFVQNGITISGSLTVDGGAAKNGKILTANISGSGTVVVTNIAVNGYVGGGPGSSMDGILNIGSKVSVSGNVTFNSTSRSTLDVQGGGFLEIGGSLGASQMGDVITSANSTIAFTGTSSQTIPALPYGYGGLKIEGGDKTLAASTAVSKVLNLTNGGLIVGPYTLTLRATSSVAGYSNSNFIKVSTGNVIVENVGSSAREIPLGVNACNPVTISNSGTIQNFTISVSESVSKYGQAVTNNIVNRTWDITPAGSGATATITLQWNSGEEIGGFNRNSCGISHWDATKKTWEKNGVAMTAASAGSLSNSWTVTRSGITSFSPFAVGDNLSPLPVELVSFKAAKTENGTALTWETASEKNNKGYEVQASADGKNFETVAFVASKNGNANYSQRYEFLDKTSRSGLVYYRLKQTDFDGTVAFYAAKVVDLGKFAESAVAYPNPFQNQFEVKLNGATSLEVTDLTGKAIFNNQAVDKGINTLSIDMTNQPAGLYLLKTVSGGVTVINRLIKQ